MPLPFGHPEDEEQFTQVVDQAAVMLWMSGPDGQCTYLSRHWIDFTGIPLEEQLGSGWLMNIHPDDRARCGAVFDAAFQKRERVSVEFRLRRRDGEYRWILDTGVPQIDRNGRFTGFMGSCIDITDRKRSEELLLESETLYRQMFEKNTAIELLVDPSSGAIVDANPAACVFYGYTLDQFRKKRLSDLHVSVGNHSGAGAGSDIWSEAPHFYARHRLESGETREMEIHAGPVELRGRRMLLYIIHDVTSRKEAEERQRATTRDLRGIVEMAFELIVCPDLNTMIRRAVELARERLGIERCGIFFCERGYVRGTYGTDFQGRTTDEHQYFIALDEVWQDRFRPRSRADSRWNVVEEAWRHWDGKAMTIGGKGWVAISPIVISTGQTIAVFCNDCAISGAPLDERKQDVVMVFCSLLGSIIERRRWEEGLRMQDRLLDAVARASNLLLASGEREDSVHHALRLIGEATNVDRVYIFENHRHQQTGVYLCSQRYEWCRDGVTPQIDNPDMQNFAFAAHGFMRHYNLLSSGKAYGGLVSELPADERNLFQSQDIRSIINVPIFIKDKFWGFVGLDDCHSDRVWTANEESIMFAMAGSLGTVMARRQAERLLLARDRLLQGVAHATQQILTATHFEEGLQLALETLGNAAGVERVYLFENLDPPDAPEHRAGTRFIWTSQKPGAPKAADLAGQTLSYETMLPNWYATLAAGKPVSGRVRDLMRPRETAVTRALLLVPVVIEGQFWGVIGFDDGDTERAWHAVDESTLNAVAGSVGGAISRKRTEDALRNSESLLRHSQKMEAVGRLAGGVAHDFNNLLTAIMGYGELIQNRLGPTDPVRKEVEEICKAADRAHGLTRQLLAFSRKQVLDPKALNLNTAFGDMEKLLRRMIGEDIELVTELAPDLGLAKVDHGQIEQVLFNLAVNARDAMPGGGRLTIATKNAVITEKLTRGNVSVPPGEYVALSVSDTGHGMSEYVQAHIFEPFFTTKEVGKGTGLGLSMVYGIIQQSNGFIMFESSRTKGTTFTIYLPRAAGGQVAPVRKASVETRGGSETILLVEDEEVVRKLAQRILTDQGYRLMTASSGTEALELCEKQLQPINLMLTDIVMPQISGRALAQRLQAMYPNLKVLYMSGYAEESLKAIGEAIDEKNFIQKPFTPTALARKVREMLDAT